MTYNKKYAGLHYTTPRGEAWSVDYTTKKLIRLITIFYVPGRYALSTPNKPRRDIHG